MRKLALLLISVVAASMTMTAHAYTCQSTTATGGCKDTQGEVHCGTHGELVPGLPVHDAANQTSKGGEIEVCSDSGAGNQQGRVVVQGDTSNGVRVILDTDKGQPFPPGYITLQVGPTSPGLWCNAKGSADSDGYAHSFAHPGTHGGTTDPQYCVPTLPIP